MIDATSINTAMIDTALINNDMINEARAQVRAFLVDHNPGLTPEAIADDTPLISSRLLTSVQLLDLLLLIESIRQEPIDARSMTPAAFSDLGSIVRTFFPGRG